MSETRLFGLDVMIDLETLGTSPNAAIIAIAAWPFRLDGEPVSYPSFYRNVDAESSVKAGGAVDGGSIMFWMGQSDEARNRLSNPPPVDLDDALEDLWAWLDDYAPEKAFRLWAHGTNFDLPILESAYRGAGYPGYPWKYNAARDTRTLFHAAGIDWDVAVDELVTVKHDALEDARAQATLVKRAWQAIHHLE